MSDLIDNSTTQQVFGGKPPDTTAGAGHIPAKKVFELYEKGSKAIRGHARNFSINNAYLAGEQWVQYSDVRNRLLSLPNNPSRVRLTVDRLLPTSRTVVAKLVQREMRFEVPPSASDDASVRGSRIAEGVLEHVKREQMWEQKREEAVWAAWIGGTAVVSVDWDPKAGTKLAFDPFSGKSFGTGDVRLSVHPITEVATEPGARDIRFARWWIRAVALPPEQVQQMYKLPEKPAPDAAQLMSPMQVKLMSGDNSADTKDLTLVLHYYERPSESSKGQVSVVVAGKEVDWSAWPFPFVDRLNCVPFRETKVTSQWTGNSVLSSAISVQTALNASWSSIVEHMKLAGNARMMAPAGSLDDADEVNDSPDSIIEYNPVGNGKPEWMSAPQMPAWWIDQPKMLAESIDDILGVHEVSRGAAPPNIESGVGLSILAEEDDTPIGTFTRDMAHGWSEIASLVLELYEDKVTEPRKASIRGSGKAPESVAWQGKDFLGQTTAVVPFEAVVPKSKAAAQAWATALWDRKIITDPKMFATVADLASRDDFIEALDADVAKAKRENESMSLGEVEIPETFDDHAKHIAEHLRQMKSERYQHLDEQAKTTFKQHNQAHETLAAEAMGTLEAKHQVSPNLAAAPNAMGHPGLPFPPAPAGMPAPQDAGEAPQTPQDDAQSSDNGPPTGIFPPPPGPDNVPGGFNPPTT